MAHEIALHHHEKYDGSGYPHGLIGTSIPLSARIVALADVYDAMTTKRVYKDAIVHAEVKQELLAGSGKHFDPEVVQAFLRAEESFQQIRLHGSEPNDDELDTLPAPTSVLQPWKPPSRLASGSDFMNLANV